MSLLNPSDPSTTDISSFEGKHGTNSSGSDQTSAKAPPHLLTLTMNNLQRSKNSMSRNLDFPWSMYVFTMFHRISFAQAVTRATTCSTKHAARLNQSSTASRRSYLHIISPTYYCFTCILNIRFTRISAN